MELVEKRKELKPQLRFREFKNSWETRKLESICKRISDGIHSTPKYDEVGEYFFVNGNNLINGNINISEGTKRVNEEEFLKHRRDLTDSTILLSINGTIGNIAFYNNEKVVLGKSAAYINLNNQENKNFIGFVLSIPSTLRYFYSELTGTTIKNLSLKTIKNLKVQYPTLPEQQKIAAFLSAVDEKIQQLTKKKALLTQYKKGVMQKLFPKKAGQAPELRFTQPNGSNYPDWEEKKLGEVGDIVSGLTYSPKDVVEEGTLVLRSSNVKGGSLVFQDKVFVNVGDGFNPLKKGDVLICVRNGSKRLIGKSAVITKEAEGYAFGAFMTVYRSSFNSFLAHYFQSTPYYKNVHRNLGATINSINGSDLKKFKVHFPSKEEQQKIADFLSGIDQKINQVETQINQTQTFKKGLLQQMFV